MSRRLRVTVDTGGTFTDVVAIDEISGEQWTTKTPSTPSDPSVAFLEGVRKVSVLAGCSPVDVTLVVHGTTIATNAVLEGKFQRLGLLVTRGFRHVLEIARQSVPDGYGNSYFWVKPPRIVPLHRVFEIGGRMSYAGAELSPLVEDDVVRAARELRDLGVDCVAVCLLHSYANATHERLVGEVLRREMPGAFISLSCDVLAEYREYERAVTTALDAMVKPHTESYLGFAESGLRDQVGKVPFLIMQSNGGVASAQEVSLRPITTLLSGPAGGVLGAVFVARQAGIRAVLTLDVGGTSTDVCLVQDLQPQLTTQSKIAHYPVKVPMLDIVTIGTGGGSIAWIGPQNALKVGPQSAGARPGPICYGFGGEAPTVTDANLVLGRIPPHLLGGEVPLNESASRDAYERLGIRLGLSIEEAAAGVLEIAAANQVNGIRQVTVQRGLDPADYCLLAFGGAGGLLGCEVADFLGIQTVLSPTNPGNLSAFGLQVSDVRRDYVRTLVKTELDGAAHELEAAWRELEEKARTDLRKEGVAEARIRLLRSADARYVGEGYEVPVPIPEGLEGEAAVKRAFTDLHDVHERTFGYSYRGKQIVEIVNLRVQAIGETFRPTVDEHRAATTAARPAARRVFFRKLGWSESPIHQRLDLSVDARVVGPAVIEEYGSTIVVYPDWQAEVDPHWNLKMVRC